MIHFDVIRHFSVDRLLQAVFMHKIVTSNGNVTFPLSVFEFVSGFQCDGSALTLYAIVCPVFSLCS